MSDSVTLTAPAKLNLSLRILARGTDGYHQLESLFIGISLADRLTLASIDRGEVRLDVQGDAGGAVGEDNLVHRAATSFLSRVSAPDAGVDMTLEKVVPVAAGLGGGSADAAAALLGLAQLFPGHVSPVDLLELGAELGSDVPFFLAPGPYALAWGRGGRLLGLPAPPSRPVLVAVPSRGISTSEAYGQFSSQGELRGGEPTYISLQELGDWHSLGQARVNDFEPVVYPRRPDLAALARSLEATAPVMSGMTGSGAAHYAIYADEGARAGARAGLAEVPDLRVFEAETLSEWPSSSSR